MPSRPLRAALALLAALGALTACGSDEPAASPTTLPAPTDSAVAAFDDDGASPTDSALAPTLTTVAPDPGADADGNPDDPQALADGSLPDGFPDAIPFPGGAEVVAAEDDAATTIVVVATPAPAQAVLAELEDAFAGRGFAVEGLDHDEFVTGAFTATGHGVAVTVTVEPAEAGTAVTYEVATG